MTITLGIVGLGNWGHRLAEAVERIDGAELTSCFSRTDETRRSFAEAHDIEPAASIAELAGSVDGVLVATPHTTHADLVVELAEFGVAIMVEKPLALSVTDADRCTDAARRNDSILQVAQYRRRAPATRRVRQLIDEGELGQLHLLEGHFSRVMPADPQRPWRENPNEAPAGAMTALGVHIVDNLLYLAGDFPTRLTAFSTSLNPAAPLDDITTMQMEFPSGAIGVLTTSLRIPKLITCAAHGSEMIAWSEEDGQRCFTLRDGDDSRTELPLVPVDPMVDNVAHFVECIRSNSQPETGGAEGTAVVRILEAMTQSAVQNGAPVEF
ncbi:MAG: Gfo/Idh/MocA family oxidoreductase [Acidimicrobiia bacterium]|nr:Gfo/Idh/MocA family oxidoreductase [Acidimicrobiia bacterium]